MATQKPQPTEDAPTSAPATLNTADPALVAILKQQADLAAFQLQLAKEQKAKEKVGLGEYRRRHPRETLPRPAYQNGLNVNPRGLSTDTINKLMSLKAGTYLGGFVTVVTRPTAEGDIVNIRYPDSSTDDRINQKSHFTSFSDLVDKVWKEMTAAAATR